MSAYIIFNYKILDRIKIEGIRGLLEPILKKYETEVIVASPVEVIEGDTYPNMVIHKFNSIEDAEHFYYSKANKWGQQINGVRTQISLILAVYVF